MAGILGSFLGGASSGGLGGGISSAIGAGGDSLASSSFGSGFNYGMENNQGSTGSSNKNMSQYSPMTFSSLTQPQQSSMQNQQSQTQQQSGQPLNQSSYSAQMYMPFQYSNPTTQSQPQQYNYSQPTISQMMTQPMSYNSYTSPSIYSPTMPGQTGQNMTGASSYIYNPYGQSTSTPGITTPNYQPYGQQQNWQSPFASSYVGPTWSGAMGG